MPDYADIAAWSVDELRQQLQETLPKGWRIEQGDHGGQLWLRLLQPNGEAAWDNIHFDARTLLLDAYCWLGLREQPRPTPETSVWGRRRRELTTRDVTRRALSIPDPEDLDPNEVRLVYEEAAKKRRQ